MGDSLENRIKQEIIEVHKGKHMGVKYFVYGHGKDQVALVVSGQNDSNRNGGSNGTDYRATLVRCEK